MMKLRVLKLGAHCSEYTEVEEEISMGCVAVLPATGTNAAKPSPRVQIFATPQTETR